MAVTAADVAKFRRAGLALLSDREPKFGDLLTPAEIIGYAVHVARDQKIDPLELIELFVRAAEVHREHIREARDTLGALGYGTQVTGLLTRLMRKAQPKPERDWWMIADKGQRKAAFVRQGGVRRRA